jgi:membrane protein implicated in regulation of membrane protease activity
MSTLCTVLVLILVAALFAWGMTDVVKKRSPSESSGDQTNRQLRGIGILVMSIVVAKLGHILCNSGMLKSK